MRFRLARDAADALTEAGIAFAVIGAAAMPAHGYARATLDLDLLVFDRRALRASVWQALEARGTPVEIRVADDDDDPVVGVVRIGRSGRRQCDVVMPRGHWHEGVIARARAEGPVLRVDGVDLPVATLTDLVAMKLDAGGPLDLRDVHELLNAHPQREAELRGLITDLVAGLPRGAREAWRRVLAERTGG